MVEIPKCPKHGEGFIKLIPAGYSKTKKRPYDAFYVCDAEGCNFTANAKDQPSYEEKKDQITEKAEEEKAYWENRKARELATSAKQTAVKAAFELAAAKVQGLEKVDITTEEVLEEAKRIYSWLLKDAY